MILDNRSGLVSGGTGALGRLPVGRNLASDPARARWLTLPPGRGTPPARVDPAGDGPPDPEATAPLLRTRRPPPGWASPAEGPSTPA